MTSANESNSENSKVFEVFTSDSKKYEISMKKVIETNKLMFHMVLMEGSQKKIFCSLYDIELLRHIKVLSPYDTTDEIFQQICDYLDVNNHMNIKSSIIIHANKVEFAIPINSKKYKHLNFELKSENSELVEILLDTVDNLMKKMRNLKKE